MPIDISEIEAREVHGRKHYFRKDNGAQVCGVKLPNQPENVRCIKGGKNLSPINGRCGRHGRDAGRPIEHGRYSQYLPERMRDALEASRNDPELLNLDETCAALDATVKRAAEMVAEKDSPGWRKALGAKYTEVDKARKAGDAEAMAQALNELGVLIRKGSSEARAIEFFQQSVERTAKRIEENWKLRLNKHNSINSTHMAAILTQFCEIVHSVLKGGPESHKILDACYRLIDVGGEKLTPTIDTTGTVGAVGADAAVEG